MKKFFRENSLSIVLMTLFLVFLIGLGITGFCHENNELSQLGLPSVSLVEYLSSGSFIEAVFENWESEFLQMWALVVLTISLRQKGADDSKPLRGKTEQDTSSRYSIIRATNWNKRRRAIGHMIYSHSLSIVLFSIFLISLLLHAVGGADSYNQEAAVYGEEQVTWLTYMATSRFWFESFQNWQSEFLAVGALLLLSIKLRERGSPESKPVGKSYDKMTGR